MGAEEVCGGRGQVHEPPGEYGDLESQACSVHSVALASAFFEPLNPEAPERSHPVLLPHLQAAGGDQAKKDDFLRQEYWRELPFTSPGDLPDPGIEATSPERSSDCEFWVMEIAQLAFQGPGWSSSSTETPALLEASENGTLTNAGT
ncbi:hypothetical protein MG293_001923 [Ovis ammon polii]|uniref:Uncharacterized protein n=1 Tax=Ovis ammon polii TaxID=230172 RepID=A0AAD4UN99_OVIAM|nr:hypothetical protein MG293_001923 [Ovis ammon polii]